MHLLVLSALRRGCAAATTLTVWRESQESQNEILKLKPPAHAKAILHCLGRVQSKTLSHRRATDNWLRRCWNEGRKRFVGTGGAARSKGALQCLTRSETPFIPLLSRRTLPRRYRDGQEFGSEEMWGLGYDESLESAARRAASANA